jgi:hypothetical protein
VDGVDNKLIMEDKGDKEDGEIKDPIKVGKIKEIKVVGVQDKITMDGEAKVGDKYKENISLFKIYK